AAAWRRFRRGHARSRFPARRYILQARRCPRGSDPWVSPAAAAAADPPHPSRPPSLGRSRPLYGTAKARALAHLTPETCHASSFDRERDRRIAGRAHLIAL